MHCVVPAGGLAPDHSRWIDSQQKFFLPVDVLKEVFRGKFVDGLRTLHAGAQTRLPRSPRRAAESKAFAAWLRPLFRSQWVVYSKRPFGGAQHALRYLGQYTHRVAISNHRLITVADGMVTFRWRDSAHQNKKRLMTLQSTNSCADSFCTCYRRDLSASAISAGWLIAVAAHRFRSACNCWLNQAGSSEASPRKKAPPLHGRSGTVPQCGGPMV